MRWRNGVVAAALALALASPAAAQQAVLGFSAGATMSDFSNPDTDTRWGFTGGVFVGKPTYRSLAMLEVNYTQKGGKTSNSDARIDYVDVSVTGGGLAGRPSGSRARVYGGVSVAFPVSCEVTNAPTNAFCDQKKTEWGLPVGIMLGRWQESGGFVGIDVRYTIALTDASLEVYNNTWMFRVMIGRPKG